MFDFYFHSSTRNCAQSSSMSVDAHSNGHILTVVMMIHMNSPTFIHLRFGYRTNKFCTLNFNFKIKSICCCHLHFPTRLPTYAFRCGDDDEQYAVCTESWTICQSYAISHRRVHIPLRHYMSISFFFSSLFQFRFYSFLFFVHSLVLIFNFLMFQLSAHTMHGSKHVVVESQSELLVKIKLQ